MKYAQEITIETIKLGDDGAIPNHPSFPLLLYREVIEDDDRPVNILSRNNWLGAWHGAVAPHHHYHSTSHEVLIVSNGTAKLLLGGVQGANMDVRQGDMIVLPAGVGHKRLEMSKDFEVIGAYPDGRDYDFCYGYEDERPEKPDNIRQVPLPDYDPLFGADGPLFIHWRQ